MDYTKKIISKLEDKKKIIWKEEEGQWEREQRRVVGMDMLNIYMYEDVIIKHYYA